ncbi:MAG: glycerol kinase GlpK [Clostridia bacterium]|nr:glycerol kinase GlpK [Clostridia bacterium]
MKKRYILALDEGTSSARCLCFDTVSKNIVDMVSHTFPLYYPQSGWVEQKATEVWAHQFGALNELIAKTGIDTREIIGIGITNQRETVVVWDKQTGEPIYNAIVWQCRRTAKYCDELKQDKQAVDTIRGKTGLIVDAYFSASKIKWILDNVPGARRKAQAGQLMCGTIDTWIIYKLTDGEVFVTDASNASRTMLFNINTLEWDDELLDFFDIPKCMMPKVVDSNCAVGQTRVLRTPITICGICGDQQSALFGQTCYMQGDAKITYGTGCFILMNMGDKVTVSSNNMLSTVAWTINGKPTYALEGSIFNAGSSVQWLRDNLKFFDNSCQSCDWAQSAVNGDGSKGSDGVYVVPAFTGLGAPYWNQNARGMIIGITRNTEKSHIIRATLESIAYSVKDILTSMQKDSNSLIHTIAVDGGASANDFLVQFQSDMLGVNIVRPASTETTALGAIYLCGLGLGVFNSLQDISHNHRIERQFTPAMDLSQVNQLYAGWQRAVSRCLNWIE